jgi:hypothetical protein
MDFDIQVSVNITPKDDQGIGNLWFNRKFTLSGERFSDIARKIDAVHDAVGKGLADEM